MISYTSTTSVLRAPLTLGWSVKGEYGFPVVFGERVVVRDFSGGIVSFKDGQECWRYPRDVGILITGATVIGTSGERLTELDLASGRVLRDVECHWDVASTGVEAFWAERRAFLGVKSLDEAEGVKVKELALVGLDDLKPLWSVSSRGNTNEVFASRAYGDGQVYVVRGNSLLAFDLDTGGQRWVKELAELDQLDGMQRMGIRPMAAAGRVVVGAPGLTVTCDAATGRVLWSSRRTYGAGVVSDARVYCGGTWEFVVLDLNDGRVLLETNLPERIEKKWGFKRVEFHTGLAVSETHLFMGDGEGRLYAFEKETGEPVWYHRPKGGNPYFGNVPVIANSRLYITTVKPGLYTPTAYTRRQGSLYCYEEASS